MNKSPAKFLRDGVELLALPFRIEDYFNKKQIINMHPSGLEEIIQQTLDFGHL